MALTTVPKVKTLLGIASSAEDDKLIALVEQADAIIKAYLNQTIEQATFTEYHDGRNQRALVLRQMPVQSVTTVHEDPMGYFGQGPDGFDATATLLTEGIDYALRIDAGSVSRSGVLYRLNSRWLGLRRDYYPNALALEPGASLGSVKVVYVAGYATVPADLTFAANQLVAQLRRSALFGGGYQVTSQTLGQHSYSLGNVNGQDAASMPLGSLRQLLAKYRDVPI